MTFLHMDEDVRAITLTKVQCMSRVGATHFEAVQVLNYKPYQHYQAHHDFFDPDYYQQQPPMLLLLRWRRRRRFPYNGDPVLPSVLDCSLGKSVTLQNNKALIFILSSPRVTWTIHRSTLS